MRVMNFIKERFNVDDYETYEDVEWRAAMGEDEEDVDSAREGEDSLTRSSSPFAPASRNLNSPVASSRWRCTRRSKMKVPRFGSLVAVVAVLLSTAVPENRIRTDRCNIFEGGNLEESDTKRKIEKKDTLENRIRKGRYYREDLAGVV